MQNGFSKIAVHPDDYWIGCPVFSRVAVRVSLASTLVSLLSSKRRLSITKNGARVGGSTRNDHRLRFRI